MSVHRVVSRRNGSTGIRAVARTKKREVKPRERLVPDAAANPFKSLK
jgi:hypothetical protein